MARILIAAALASGVAGAAGAAAAVTPTEIVKRHEAAAAKADVDAMMADYADDATVLEANRTLEGKAAIRALFTRMFPHDPAGAPASGAPRINVTRIWEEGNVGMVSWTMGAVAGVDSFLVRNGKIAVQAVFISSQPPAPK